MFTKDLIQEIEHAVNLKENWHLRIEEKFRGGKGSCIITIITHNFEIIFIDINSSDDLHKGLIGFAELANTAIDNEDEKFNTDVETKARVESVFIKACSINIDYKKLDVTIAKSVKDIYKVDKYTLKLEIILNIINNLNSYY
jgi:hypothetical protein